MLSSSCSLLATKHGVSLHAGLSPFSLLFYNNILALPMMLTYLLGASNEATAVAAYPSLQSLTFWVSLTLNVIVHQGADFGHA